MTEIATFIRELGVPISAMVALAVVLYKIGTVCGTLLIESWRNKDTRLSELEQRVNTINNGQREALQTQLDVSTDALHRVGACLEKLGGAFANFASGRPCLSDSDAVKLTAEIAEEMTPDPEPEAKTLAAIERQRRRAAKREES